MAQRTGQHTGLGNTGNTYEEQGRGQMGTGAGNLGAGHLGTGNLGAGHMGGVRSQTTGESEAYCSNPATTNLVRISCVPSSLHFIAPSQPSCVKFSCLSRLDRLAARTDLACRSLAGGYILQFAVAIE
jgi:hypothetical protein